jgi:hypothetical protein
VADDVGHDQPARADDEQQVGGPQDVEAGQGDFAVRWCGGYLPGMGAVEAISDPPPKKRSCFRALCVMCRGRVGQEFEYVTRLA